MMFDIKPYKVYVKTDENGHIMAINSDAFLSSIDDWLEIDNGHGDKYHHAQGHYFPLSIRDDRAIYRYMTAPVVADPDREAYHTYEYEGETWGIYERTQEEMDADWDLPEPTPTQLDIIEAQVTYTAMMTDTLLEV